MEKSYQRLTHQQDYVGRSVFLVSLIHSPNGQHISSIYHGESSQNSLEKKTA